ncbi:MAG: SDR family NAD(P)-dependent oxidoreductase [Synergistales bacterium]
MKEILKSMGVQELFNVRGKIVLVSGSGGLGSSIAMAFARGGASVFVADCLENKLQELQAAAVKENVRISTLLMDVSDKASVEAGFKALLEKTGRLDVVVHTAGMGKNEAATDCEEMDIRRTIDVNLIGTILVNQQAARIMKEQRYGKIVNLGSIAGIMAHTLRSMPYAASKAGVHQVTRSFAAEMAQYGVNVNCVAPAWINTPLIAKKDEAYYENIRKSVPFQRMGEPDEILGAVFFLSTDASHFVTGQVILVDGGWSVTKALA